MDIYVLDLCPQANVSETILGGGEDGSTYLSSLLDLQPRGSIAGYLEDRLNSPFSMTKSTHDFVTMPHHHNKDIPKNLYLIAGDNLLEILAEAIRQTSQLAIPVDAWAQVTSWIQHLVIDLRKRSGDRDAAFLIDCNPSFAMYTQLALVAADHIVVPFTADDSSRRGIENVIALLYGIGTGAAATYARLTFAQRAKDEGVNVPKLHSFVSNRVTLYEGKASRAFQAATKNIQATVARIQKSHRNVFSNPTTPANEDFLQVPDYHSACIVATMTGTPLHRLKAGPRNIAGERVQLNPEPLERYRRALQTFVERL